MGASKNYTIPVLYISPINVLENFKKQFIIHYLAA